MSDCVSSWHLPVGCGNICLPQSDTDPIMFIMASSPAVLSKKLVPCNSCRSANKHRSSLRGESDVHLRGMIFYFIHSSLQVLKLQMLFFLKNNFYSAAQSKVQRLAWLAKALLGILNNRDGAIVIQWHIQPDIDRFIGQTAPVYVTNLYSMSYCERFTA